MRTGRLRLLLPLLGLAAGLAPLRILPAQETLVLDAPQLFTAVDEDLVQNGRVVVRGGRILAAGPRSGIPVPEGAKVLRLGGCTLLPGLIDLHAHILVGTPAGGGEAWETDPALWEGRLAGFLRSGVTSVRDLGDLPEEILELRRRERAGELLAPRIFAVGPIVTAPGGHPNPRTITIRASAEEVERVALRVDSAEEARAAARHLHALGVDAIKCVYTGGPAFGGLPKLKEECLRAVTEEAHRLGLRVVCHTDTLEDARTALQAGVDGLEHGVDVPGQEVDEAFLELLRASGAFYVPTLSVLEAFLLPVEFEGILDWPETRRSVPRRVRESLRKHPRVAALRNNPAYARSVRARLEASRANLQRVAEGGGRIALGSDCGNFLTFFGPATVREVELMAESGLGPARALLAGTRDAARHLGRGEDLGTLEPGRLADLLAVRGNPLRDPAVLRNPVLVMKGGEILDLEDLEERIQGTPAETGAGSGSEAGEASG